MRRDEKRREGRSDESMLVWCCQPIAKSNFLRGKEERFVELERESRWEPSVQLGSTNDQRKEDEISKTKTQKRSNSAMLLSLEEGLVE